MLRPEKQRLLDALWPVLVSFCDAGKHGRNECVQTGQRTQPERCPGK
jgi:hypothetical protein